MQVIINSHAPRRRRGESEIPNCICKLTLYNYKNNYNNMHAKSEMLQVINLN